MGQSRQYAVLLRSKAERPLDGSLRWALMTRGVERLSRRKNITNGRVQEPHYALMTASFATVVSLDSYSAAGCLSLNLLALVL